MTCEYCRRTYARHQPTCDGCGAGLEAAFDVPMLFDPGIIDGASLQNVWTGDWIPVDPAFNVASLPKFNPYRVGIGGQMWNQYDGWTFDEYLNHYYYGEEPTR